MEVLNIIFWITYFISLYLVIFWLLVYLDHGTTDQRKQLRRRPFVSIVIPAHNEEKNIIATITSALRLDYPKRLLEILVVENGSTDRTTERTQAFLHDHPHAPVTLLHSKIGKGAALNVGLRRAKGEIFICLDADSRVLPHALQTMLPHFEDENVGAVLPTLKVEKPTTFVQKIQWFEYTVTFFLKKMMGHLNAVYVAPGPFSVYRKKYLEKLGGFDEHNLTEDMEIAFKMQKAHYKLVQLMQTVVYTKTPQTIMALYRQRNRWYKGGLQNMIKYRAMLFRKEYGEFGILQMPLMWTALLLSTCVFVFIYYRNFLRPLWEKLYHLSFIDFDIHFTFAKFLDHLTMSLLALDYVTIFFIYFAFILGLIYICTAFRSNKERLFKEKLGTPLFYLFLYPIAILLIWAGVVFDLLRGKRQRW